MGGINLEHIDRVGNTNEIERKETVDDSGVLVKDAGAIAIAKGQGISGYETLPVWETVKTFKFNTFICGLVTFSAATDGYQIGMNGNVIANQGFVKQFATERNASGEPNLASPILSGWSSIMSVGQIIGMTTLPFLSDRFGRKVAMYCYWSILAISILLETLGRSWQTWLIAKLLAGIGVGCLQTTIPTYITEVAPVKIRGALLMTYSFWFSLGNFFAPVALQVLSKKDPHKYLIPIYTQWAHVGLMIIIYFFVPESPAWCVTRGREEQAKRILRFLNCDVKDYDVEKQFQILSLTVEHERFVAAEQRQEKWYSTFKGTNGFRTIIALWPLLSQQFLGLTLFSTFSSYFFQQAGVEDPFMVTCITTAIGLATGVVLIGIVDKFGRRLACCCGVTLSWLSCAVVGILGVIPQNGATNIVLIVFACLWNVGFVAIGSTGWGFIGEISSQRLRPYTAGFGAATTCVVGIIMNVLTPYMVNTNQWNWNLKTGWFYAGVGLPVTVAAWFLIPETARRSAAELDELFELKVKPWRFHKTETATNHVVNVVGHDGRA